MAQALTHFQKLINKVLIGLPFAFGYLDDIMVCIEYKEKMPWSPKNCISYTKGSTWEVVKNEM